MRPGRLLFAGAVGVGLVALTPRPVAAAGAGDKRACIAISEQGQQLRSDGRLREAREQFLRCTANECPSVIRQDCAQWVSEVAALLPTLVLGARDGDGHDVLDVRVTIDGEALPGGLDGREIALDPGVHVLRFERSSGALVEERVLVKRGEKNRVVVATFASPAPAAAVQPVPPPVQATLPLGVPILAGAGVAALGAALYLDLSATSDAHDLRARCAPNCPPGDVDAVRTRYVVAGVTAGAGLVAVGVATALFFTSRRTARAEASARVDVRPVARGAVAEVGLRF